MENEIKLREYPILGWLFGFGIMASGAYYAFTQFPSSSWMLGAFGGAVGSLFLIFGYALTITADRQTRILTLDYRSALFRSVKEIPFDTIQTIRIDSSISRNNNGSRSTTYRIQAELKTGEVAPFRSYYSSDFVFKQRIVDRLRSFMNLPETFDESPMGVIRGAPKFGAMAAEQQQETLTGENDETRVTDGVHWNLQSIGIGATPATRWFSPDFKMRNGFLFLAQSAEGQASSGFLVSISTMLFKQSLSLYGFSESDTPNRSQAQLYDTLSPALGKHFMAFTSDPSEAKQLLNPWVQNPLANWGARYPLKQFQGAGARYSQIVVLYSPNGVYIATPVVLQPDQVEEITALGVELVKAQGM